MPAAAADESPVNIYGVETQDLHLFYYDYLRFLERARTEWLRSLGYSQRELAKEPGIVFAVVSLSIEYRKPARLDDELVVTCEPQLDGSATIVFGQQIYRETSLLVEANVRVACLDAHSLRPKRLPESLRQNMKEPS